MENTRDAVCWVNVARAWSNAVICLQFCADRLHLQSNFSKRMNEFFSKGSRRLVPHRRLYFCVLRNRSSSSNSSNKTPVRVRLSAPGNWCSECKKSRERIRVTQQITQSHSALGNWSVELSQLLRKSFNLESTQN